MLSRDIFLKDCDKNLESDYYYAILDVIYDPYFDQYDDILVLDTDIYISPTAENIFDIVQSYEPKQEEELVDESVEEIVDET